MATKVPAKKKTEAKKTKPAPVAESKKSAPAAPASAKQDPVQIVVESIRPKESAKDRDARERRQETLHQMLMGKRQEIIREIEGNLGQSLTEDQQRRLESARDVGDQALMDLDRELGISLMEMRNRRRQVCRNGRFSDAALRRGNCNYTHLFSPVTGLSCSAHS